MKSRVDAPELNDAIQAHARALAAGDARAAESHIAAAVLESHRAIFREHASDNPLGSFEVLARAKIGNQFMSKIRLSGRAGTLTLLNRWIKSADGKWQIAEIDDLSTKRSGWSDIAPLGVSRSESRNG
jgi:hypothetical protein